MNNKKLMWLILAVIVVFAIFNIFSFFNNRANYSQVAFKAVYTFGRNNETKMENDVSFSYEDQNDLQESLSYFQDVSLEEKTKNYEEVLKKLEEQSDKPLELIDYNSKAYMDEGLLKIEETAVVSGLVEQKGDRWVTGFGENRLELKEDSNSSLIFVLPGDAEILSITPEPTSRDGNVLRWERVGQIPFPVVEYK